MSSWPGRQNFAELDPEHADTDGPAECAPLEATQKEQDKENKSTLSTSPLNQIGKFCSHLTEAVRNQTVPPPVLTAFSLQGVADYIRSGKCANIVVLTGAGISTSAGIPDFRSPGSGLYHNLEKYNLPYPQAIFEISFFKENPQPFYVLAKALYPGQFKPTPCHYFIRMLHDKGLLLRNYTQNIDTLEHIAGVPLEKVIEAHGTFRIGHCTNMLCRAEYSQQWMKEECFADRVPTCTKCNAVVKPDIVFFGESLPMRFFQCAMSDFNDCDLLIVMGTSLVVQPFASLVDRVGVRVPRLLVNKEKAGVRNTLERLLGQPGLDFDDERNYRDVFWEGDCDEGCQQLANLLGWGDELRSLIAKEWSEIDKQEEQTANAKVERVKSPPGEATDQVDILLTKVDNLSLSPTTTSADSKCADNNSSANASL